MPDSAGREAPQLFDLIFKRLMREASSRAVVALINGLFGVNYPLDSKVIFLNTEHVSADLRRSISDIIIVIAGDAYHIEAQIDDNLNMALRMFRYGVQEALKKEPEPAEDKNLTIRFPQARVLYWETTQDTPDQVTLHIIFPDQSVHDFTVPTFKVLKHEIGYLQEKQLALLLPFYVLKYRQAVKKARSEEDRQALIPKVEETMQGLLNAVQELRKTELLTAGDEEIILGEIELLYAKLYEPYKEFEEAKKMVDERIMTRFDKLRMEVMAEGRAAGRAEGRAAGITEGMVKGEAKGKAEVAMNLLKAGVSRDIIAQATGLTLADLP